MKIKIIYLLCIGTIFFGNQISSAQPPPGQEISGQERMRKLEEEEKELRERIEKKEEPPKIEEKIPPVHFPLKSEEKIFIKDIRIKGITLISQQEINDIIPAYKNKELMLSDMQKAADLITDAYRQKGYVTSRAYLPPQKIQENILEILVLEGLTGDIQVKGNRYFKTDLFKNKISLTKKGIFNYNTLRKNLAQINAQPDRNVRAILIPGKELITTDIVLEVKDRLPIHIGFDWDNFGSRYIRKDRYSLRFSHNNLLGLDDKLSFQYQLAQDSRYFLKSLRYLLPLVYDCELGFYLAQSRVKLGEDFQDSDARGKSHLYGIFLNKSLIDKENLDLNFNLGFDYKDVTNYQNQTVSSNDRIRLFKTGLDIDNTDTFGRTIISNVLDFGVPNIMGGIGEQDQKSSRSGAGGKFIRNTINLLRLQRMPFSSNLLWKNQIQSSPYILPATEQFQIGGIANVRGYPPAEVVGDNGYAMTWEWSFPPYFISRNTKLIFSKAKLYDTLRVAIFYDWANAHLRRPTATEEKNKTLRGVGYGLRLNMPENFSVRLDFAWPLDNTPSDSNHLHTWVQVSKNF